MYLDYSKLKFDMYGRPEVPELVLKTLSNDTIGILNGVHDLKFNVKFSEPSEMTFTIPSTIKGKRNPHYDKVGGRKIIYTEDYGIYVTMNPEVTSDGVAETKIVKAYSLEKRLEDKRFFIEEGTFNFYHPADEENTVIGRILEVAHGWSIGYVSPTLIGRYRTFEQYDDYLLPFIYNTAPEKFRCVFVFNPYNKTISVYDADEERPVLPIYLDFDNLLENAEVEEVSNELITALRPYGADGLDIRSVNPIGTNWIYNLSNFISNGDIPSALANKWQAWQKDVLASQENYRGLIALRASANAKLLKLEAELVELNGELTNLKNEQSIIIQQIAIDKSLQLELDENNEDIRAVNKQIDIKNGEIATLKKLIGGDGAESTDGMSSYDSYIEAIIDRLYPKDRYENGEIVKKGYFEPEEYEVLQEYFIEQDVTEDTFVATAVDTTVSGSSYDIGNSVIKIEKHRDENGKLIPETILITRIDMPDFGKQIYTISGGTFSTSGETPLSCNIVRGTLEVNKDSSYVMSIYAGEITVNDKKLSSGLITVNGTISKLSSDIIEVTDSDIITYEGTFLSFDSSSGSMYLTVDVNEYQKYAVQLELFDYASGLLSELATPTYEFSVDSGNFLFAKEFAPFRNKLELGSSVYLNTGLTDLITPIIIEIEFSFEDQSDFSLVFSNRFKRHDSVNTLKDMIEKGYSSGRSFDSSKYIYNQSTKYSSAVSDFMNGSLNAAKNAIIAASNQSVKIDGAGIHVGGNSDYQLRIIDSMIAMTKDGWSSSKLAIGRFYSDAKTGLKDDEDKDILVGETWGVNGELLAGNLIIGNNLVLENVNDNGVMQFKVDATGAWLNNSTFVLQKDAGGKIIIDPKYGIVAGFGDLFTTSGTTVSPSFVNKDGYIELDDDGMPLNTSFFLDIETGNAYFRGIINATEGKIGGWSLGDDCLFSGNNSSYVSINASSDNNAAYALWAGSQSPESAPFCVTKNGDLYAKNGVFSGTVKGAIYRDSDGQAMMNSNEEFKSDYLNLKGISVTDRKGSTTFEVDSSGNVTLKGKIIAPIFYASSDDSSTYAELTSGDLRLVSNGTDKIVLDYGSSNKNYASLSLGNTNPGIIEKSYSGGHYLWIGDENQSCGILFNFNRCTYRIYGSQEGAE